MKDGTYKWYIAPYGDDEGICHIKDNYIYENSKKLKHYTHYLHNKNMKFTLILPYVGIEIEQMFSDIIEEL
jgi:hypothetical protein